MNPECPTYKIFKKRLERIRYDVEKTKKLFSEKEQKNLIGAFFGIECNLSVIEEIWITHSYFKKEE